MILMKRAEWRPHADTLHSSGRRLSAYKRANRILMRAVNCIAVAFLAVATMFALPGCGKSDRGSISGTLLRKDGSPVATSRVVARSKESGATAYGTTDKAGYFEINDGLAPGDYDLNILEDRGDPDSRRPATIAAKYRDPAKSGLSVNVQAGRSATVNLTLDPP
jgi:Carboxypeptidase regulatory-like domain